MKRLMCICLLLASCQHKAPVRLPATTGNGYVFNNDGRIFYVIAQNDEALKDAMKRMGCGVCTTEQVGTAYTIERITK